MSGRLSSCSVVQEESLARRMRKTPGTPIKSGYQTTPRKSESKRSLFQSNTPVKSDDLGLMSPLSPSSCSSTQSLNSPQFSPNGKLSTPPRTPKSTNFALRCSPKISSKKIEVKSSLFPDLKLHTPKSKHTLKTPHTVVSKLTRQCNSYDEIDEGIRSLTTPPSSSRKLRKRQIFEDNMVSETDSSPSFTNSTSKINDSFNNSNDKPSKLGIKPLSCEDFYGPVPQPPKARARLFIDTLEPRSGGKTLIRSFSRDSLSSNRSFVSGGSRKKTESNCSKQTKHSKSSNNNRRRIPHIGVWHNIKKPKQIKKIVKAEKPLISPISRLGKMLSNPPKKEIKVKSKPFFQEISKKRTVSTKKRSRNEIEENGIIDSFPDHLIKRKKLPILHSIHPAINESKVKSPESITPDPNKKFVKYGQSRKATFTLSENVKLQISDGVMKLQTPKKRRKLYSGKRDIVEDFNDFDECDNDFEQSIQGILNTLQCDKDINTKQQQVEKISDTELINILESPSGKMAASSKVVTKIQRSPLKTVSNLSTLIINDFESDDDEISNSVVPKIEKKINEVTLEKTGNMVSYTTNILVNDENVEGYLPDTNSSENLPPNDEKYFSLFYKQNWNKLSINNDDIKEKHSSIKKKAHVPDDQYLLDAGQKSIGIVTCKKCGVMYQSGDFADEATHNNFHNNLPELRFNGWNNERVVGKYSDGRVIMVVSADPKVWWQKVSKIVDIVDKDLGFPEASVQSLFYKTVYLFINEKAKQIVGCLIAEECKVAYKMFPPLEGVDIDSCSKDPSPCKVGISRIWTALSHRRKGVASRLIECLQRSFIFGEITPMNQIAFSVPSPLGKLLAQKVTGRYDFLVYGFA